MPPLAGKDFKLYYGDSALASADASTGTWNEITVAQNVTRNTSRDQFEANSRGNSGFKQYLDGLKDATIETTLIYDPSNASYAAIKSAYDNSTPIAIADMDGAIATPGSTGIAGNWKVTQFNVDEPLDGPGTVAATFAAYQYTHFYTTST